MQLAFWFDVAVEFILSNATFLFGYFLAFYGAIKLPSLIESNINERNRKLSLTIIIIIIIAIIIFIIAIFVFTIEPWIMVMGAPTGKRPILMPSISSSFVTRLQ